MEDTRKYGFMIGIGLVVDKLDRPTAEAIVQMLAGYDLDAEIKNGQYAQVAYDEGVNPCPVGSSWNSDQRTCA